MILALWVYRAELKVIQRIDEIKKVSPVVVGAASVGTLGASTFKMLENYIDRNIIGAFSLSVLGIMFSGEVASLIAYQCLCALEE